MHMNAYLCVRSLSHWCMVEYMNVCMMLVCVNSLYVCTSVLLLLSMFDCICDCYVYDFPPLGVFLCVHECV